MNYYERHLGDYAKDAGHLSQAEHGAYTLLLDRYYGTEQPIPEDQAYRVTRARSPAEKLATDSVLAEFFTLQDGAYRNSRADREISKAQAKISAARENGKQGGRPKKNQDPPPGKPTGFQFGSVLETQVKAHQTPDTKHQTPDKTKDPTHTHLATSTDGGRVCFLLKANGISDTNPGHPALLALIEAGASDAEFIGAAQAAAGKGKGFAYAIGTLSRQRTDAAQAAQDLHRGPMPTKADARVAANIAVAQRFLERTAK